MYSFPGLPFKDIQKMSDKEIFDALYAGAKLHIHRGEMDSTTVSFSQGLWKAEHSYGGRVSTKEFANFFDMLCRVNGLGVATFIRGGEDMDVTLEV